MTHPLNILLVGSGGREHALAWKLVQSNFCKKLFIAPGNAGTLQHGENVAIPPGDFPALADFVRTNEIEMLIVGPEDPLVNGISDYFNTQIPSLKVVGPGASGARLEGSKEFSKLFMQRHHIPTATYCSFTLDTVNAGLDYISTHGLPIVLKADGLAAGKGVVICDSREAAKSVFIDMIVKRQFGNASAKVVVEQFLSGIELSVFVVTDGMDYKIIGHAKDYKRVGEADTGPNTGGMGCISPVPFADKVFMQKVTEQIIEPTIRGLQSESIPYKGFIFFGLINVQREPFVIEYNCRMGDPETEVVMPRLENDFVLLLSSLFDGSLHTQQVTYKTQSAATVVAVSGGYPGVYKKGIPVRVPEAETGTMIFHAGTQMKNGQLLTNGGRVLAVTSYGGTIEEATAKSNALLQQIHFDGMYYRKDIGYEFNKA